MNQNIKIISNTVDAKLSVESQSLKTLFKNSLLGMNQLLKRDYRKNLDGDLIFSEIEIFSYDSTSLLLNFLSEILALSHSTHIIFCSIQFLVLTDKYLLVKISGTKIDKFDNDLRTVSFHNAEIIKNQNGNYQTDIIFDYR